MSKTFLIQNNYGKNLGEITYLPKRFKVSVSSPQEKKQLEDLLNKFLKEGIRNLGEVILKEPIKPGDPLFLNEVRNQLARRGYIMIEKKKSKI